jgi:hypothetical protein
LPPVQILLLEGGVRPVPPEVFGGYKGSPETGYIVRPEKALFDAVYIRAPRGGGIRFPELTLPEDFHRGLLEGVGRADPSTPASRHHY